MKIDWQAFDDGVLRLEDRDRAIAAIASNPAAKRELEGLRRFKSAVRRAALAEHVPTAKLESILKSVAGSSQVRPQRRPLNSWVVAASVAGAIVIAAAANFLPVGVGGGDSKTVEVTSPAEAQQRATQFSGMNVRLVDIGSFGKVQTVHAGKGWACLDFQVQHYVVHVTVQQSRCSTSSYEPVQTQNGVYFKSAHSQMIVFESAGAYYTIYGGTDQQRSRVAELVLASLARQ